MPGLDLDDPRLRTASPEQIVAAFQRDQVASRDQASRDQASKASKSDATEETLLETMMQNFGSLNVDEQGHWDYQGHSSNVIFMQRLRDQFGESVSRPSPLAKLMSKPEVPTGNTVKQLICDPSLPTCDLPAEDTAMTLCRIALDQACVLTRFVHEPSFWSTFSRIYATSWDQYTAEERSFLPQLFAVLAIGCLFADDVENILDVACYEEATEQGYDFLSRHSSLTSIGSNSSKHAVIWSTLPTAEIWPPCRLSAS